MFTLSCLKQMTERPEHVEGALRRVSDKLSALERAEAERDLNDASAPRAAALRHTLSAADGISASARRVAEALEALEEEEEEASVLAPTPSPTARTEDGHATNGGRTASGERMPLARTRASDRPWRQAQSRR